MARAHQSQTSWRQGQGRGLGGAGREEEGRWTTDLLGFVTHGIARAKGGVHACVGGWWGGSQGRERALPSRLLPIPAMHARRRLAPPHTTAENNKRSFSMFPFRRGTHPPHITAPHASAPLPVFILRPLSVRVFGLPSIPPPFPDTRGLVSSWSWSVLVLVYHC